MSDRLSILFVCTGNICRSPYAERRSASISRVHRFASAGTHALVDHPMDAEMALLARARGARTEGFVGKQVSKELLYSADLILTAEAGQRSWILTEWPGLVRRLFSLGQFTSALPESPIGLDPADVVRWVGEQRPAASRSFDIDDPYRKGPDAARACADRIDSLLLDLFDHLG